MNDSKVSARALVTARFAILLVSISMIIVGITHQEHLSVLQKAVRICLECIGIG